MCQFNLLIIDKKYKNDDLKKLMINIGFGYRELENESLKNQIGNNIKVILTTKGHCDCGSILGINHQGELSIINVKKEKKKLQKKKWSESKIERYLNDKLKEQNKKEDVLKLGNKAEEKKWIEITQILAKQKYKFGILFHQFGGQIEDEEIELREINKIPIELLSKGELRNFKDNQLNWVEK